MGVEMKVKQLIEILGKLDPDKEIEYFFPDCDFQSLAIERIVEYKRYYVIQ